MYQSNIVSFLFHHDIMNTRPITNYKIINPYISKSPISKSPISKIANFQFFKIANFQFFSPKVGFHVLTYHQNIPTYPLASRVINHSTSVYKVSSFLKSCKVHLLFTSFTKPIHIQSKPMINHS